MRQPQRDKVELIDAAIATPAEVTESAVDTPAVDWRELGRRVLSEAMKRSMRELRRRNGSAGNIGVFRGHREGRS